MRRPFETPPERRPETIPERKGIEFIPAIAPATPAHQPATTEPAAAPPAEEPSE